MSKIEIIDHVNCPDDNYIKEIAHVCFDGKYKVLYVRKLSKMGGLFWSNVSVGVVMDGQKEYFNTFVQDSMFDDQAVKKLLEARGWEKKQINESAACGLSSNADYFQELRGELPF